MDNERFVEKAETQYNEWIGTVAFDDPHDQTVDLLRSRP